MKRVLFGKAIYFLILLNMIFGLIVPVIGVIATDEESIFLEATTMKAIREPATKTKLYIITGNLGAQGLSHSGLRSPFTNRYTRYTIYT